MQEEEQEQEQEQQQQQRQGQGQGQAEDEQTRQELTDLTLRTMLHGRSYQKYLAKRGPDAKHALRAHALLHRDYLLRQWTHELDTFIAGGQATSHAMESWLQHTWIEDQEEEEQEEEEQEEEQEEEGEEPKEDREEDREEEQEQVTSPLLLWPTHTQLWGRTVRKLSS